MKNLYNSASAASEMEAKFVFQDKPTEVVKKTVSTGKNETITKEQHDAVLNIKLDDTEAGGTGTMKKKETTRKVLTTTDLILRNEFVKNNDKIKKLVENKTISTNEENVDKAADKYVEDNQEMLNKWAKEKIAEKGIRLKKGEKLRVVGMASAISDKSGGEIAISMNNKDYKLFEPRARIAILSADKSKLNYTIYTTNAY